ncbi:phage Gp37/Gp68 family protein, partial [Escherichia coli]|nr:phage Gp37/Gp68 family protein [Escherichia coli]
MQKCGLPPNVWLGATICNQAEADRDIPKLLSTPAAVRFLSVEPMLGDIELTGHEYSVAPGLDEGIDWLTGKTS